MKMTPALESSGSAQLHSKVRGTHDEEASFSCIGRCGWRFSAGFVPVDVVGYLHLGFQKPVTRFKTGTVPQKNYFCIFEFRSIKYKKPDPVYRPGPDRERKKNPETGGSRPRFETLPPPSSRCRAFCCDCSSPHARGFPHLLPGAFRP